jgi:hypothetical protein
MCIFRVAAWILASALVIGAADSRLDGPRVDPTTSAYEWSETWTATTTGERHLATFDLTYDPTGDSDQDIRGTSAAVTVPTGDGSQLTIKLIGAEVHVYYHRGDALDPGWVDNVRAHTAIVRHKGGDTMGSAQGTWVAIVNDEDGIIEEAAGVKSAVVNAGAGSIDVGYGVLVSEVSGVTEPYGVAVWPDVPSVFGGVVEAKSLRATGDDGGVADTVTLTNQTRGRQHRIFDPTQPEGFLTFRVGTQEMQVPYYRQP